MSTKVFLSWSGDLSRKAAEIFKEWLGIVIQELEVFYSEDDIIKGSNGIETIFRNLRESVASVIMLTKENQTSPWICFEAGAIFSKSEDSIACGLLLDFSCTKLEGPLKNIQQTPFEKKEVFKLLKAINSKCSTPLDEDRLKRIFEINWPNLHKDLSALISSYSTKNGIKSHVSTSKLASGKKQTVTEESQVTPLPYQQQILKAHSHELLKVLQIATEFNDQEKEWSIRDMKDALKTTFSTAEALVGLCTQYGFIQRKDNYYFGSRHDPYLYRILPEGILLISNSEKGKL